MSKPVLFSLIESPHHPNHSALFARLGYEEVQLTSTRKAVSQLKKQPPDVVVADFVYGFSNNYSGVHISNLDVLLMSMQKFAPEAEVIILTTPQEMAHAEKMREICPVKAILPYTVAEQELAALLQR
jgi:hypothetical protein